MISKKELNNRIGDNYRQINRHGSSLNELRVRVHGLEAGQDDNHSRIAQIERILTNTRTPSPEIKQLQQHIGNLCRQVQCGVVGHKFQLVEVAHFAILSKNIAADRFGLFRCKECGLTIKRELTKQEVEAAKKLGMIK